MHTYYDITIKVILQSSSQTTDIHTVIQFRLKEYSLISVDFLIYHFSYPSSTIQHQYFCIYCHLVYWVIITCLTHHFLSLYYKQPYGKVTNHSFTSVVFYFT